MSDWSRDKARLWLNTQELLGHGSHKQKGARIDSLAAMLDEVALMGPGHDAKTLTSTAKAREAVAEALVDVARRETLDAVMRVVEDERTRGGL